MKERIDSSMDQHIDGQRLSMVEPLFGYLAAAIQIKRFSLRGERKADGQWKLMLLLLC